MCPKIKKAHDLFDDWYMKQKLIEEYQLTSHEKRTTNLEKQHYQKFHHKFKPYPQNLNQIKNYIHGTTPTKKNFTHLDELKRHLEDPSDFFSYLQKKHITSKQINVEEEKIALDPLIAKYNTFARMLYPHKSRKEQYRFLYTLANAFFFFAFEKRTFPIFHKFVTTDTYHPCARFIYAVIWQNLASKGWSTWHNNCIKNLQEHAYNKEIVYCAGGTDILPLLQNDLCTIRIIDPFIPRQKKFYANIWRFFIQGALGDQIHIPRQHDALILKRTHVQKKGTFCLLDKKLLSYVTTWKVYKNNGNKPCGTITFERRPIKQDDFARSKAKIPLISLNELYFITKATDNWGIKLYKLPKNLQLFVKQLKKPLDKQTLLNMRKADRSETLDFIQLGSNID